MEPLQINNAKQTEINQKNEKRRKFKIQDSAELIVMRSNSYFTYQPQNFYFTYQPQNFLLFQKSKKNKIE